MDLVKTRLQMQRPSPLILGKQYKNSRDCLVKVAKLETPFSLYRGVFPQMIGVALGKAVKLSVCDATERKAIALS